MNENDKTQTEQFLYSALYEAAKGKFSENSLMFQAAFQDVEGHSIEEMEPYINEQVLAVLIALTAFAEDLEETTKGLLKDLCLLLLSDKRYPGRLVLKWNSKGRRRSLDEVILQAASDAQIATFVANHSEYGRESAVAAAEAEFVLSRSKVYEALARVTKPANEFVEFFHKRWAYIFENKLA